MEKDTSRIEAFSDGIFGVAITLLGVEIAVKEGASHTNDGLRDAILSLWPKYFGYVNSFATIILMWLAHHDIFKLLKKSSPRLILANGFLLMVVALVPFPTKTMVEFIETDARQAAVIFYTGYFVLVALAFNLLWFVACRSKGLLIETVPQSVVQSIRKNQMIGLFCNLAITAVAFINPLAALVLSFIMLIFWGTVTQQTND